MTTERQRDLAEREFIPGLEGFRRRRTQAARVENERPVLQDPSIVETGFFGAQQGAGFTGNPTTVAERDFIIDFINQTGARPNQFDVAAFKRNQPNAFNLDENRVFTPESVQFQQGFRTGADYLRAQRAGQNFGPFAGDLVPFGGLVTFDPATGQPLNRTFEPNAAVSRGEFIPPPGGLDVTQQNVFGDLPQSQFQFGTGGDIGDTRGREQFFPRSGQVTFQPPSFEQAFQEGLVKTDPVNLYGANLFDYLASQQFPQRGAGGEIFQEGMTTEEANGILEEVERLIRQGVPVESLPFFNESQGAEGEQTDALRERLYGDLVTGLREEWEQRRVGFGQTARNVSSGFGPSRDSGAGGRAGSPSQPTGTERGEYLQWIKELDMAHNPEQWAIGQFRNMFDIWLASGGGVPFIDWVENYLAPLEEFEQVPQFGERIQAPRARTLRR